METTSTRFEPGTRVRATENLFNDGTIEEHPAHALLVRRGEAGDIVQVARKVESGALVYFVEFALNQVIGCTECELMPWRSGQWCGNARSAARPFLYGGLRGCRKENQV